MPVSISFGRELPLRVPAPRDNSPFRILVIGDFGSNRSWGRPVAIDRDDLDDVIRRWAVQITLQLGPDGPEVRIPISEFSDFHPDSLLRKLLLFESLRTRRQRLLSPATAKEEISAILGSRTTGTAVTGSPAAAVPHLPPTSNPVDAAALLSQVLGSTEASRKPIEQQVLEGTVDWDSWVRQLVAPYLVDRPDPRQAELLSSIDSAVSEAMRTILHHPDFQRIEAAWQGVRFLVRRLETDRTLQLFLLNVPAAEFSQDLLTDTDPAQTRFHRLLVDSSTEDDSDPWTVVVGNYQFSADPRDCQILGRAARIAGAGGAALIFGGSPSVSGCPGFDLAPDSADWSAPSEPQVSSWLAVRSLPEASHLTLVVPRVMARQPYGRESDPIDSFEFTEIPDATQHEHYLWMNGVFPVAFLLGQAFSRLGWRLSSGISDEVDGMPLYVYSQGGEDCLKSCCEAELTTRAVERLARDGLTVIRSVRDDDAARIAAIRSLSVQNPRLAGSWE